MVKLLSGDGPWWMTRAGGESTSACLNKLDGVRGATNLVSSCLLLCWLDAGEGEVELLVSVVAAPRWEAAGLGVASLLRRGGSGKESRCLDSAVSWEEFQAAADGAHQWQQVSVVVILGLWSRSVPWCSWRHGIFYLQADVPVRRPFFSSAAALYVELSPSGLVPGDGVDGRCELCIHGGEGPNCIPNILVEVLSVISRDLVVFLFIFEVLVVCCNPTI